MRTLAKVASSLGCLCVIAGPLGALVLYPRANWLFAFPLIGVAIIVLHALFSKDPPPKDVADGAERLLDGTYRGWEVDDYEHLNPHEARLRDLWQATMKIGGLPEEWARLDESKKSELREIIVAIRHLGHAVAKRET
jgi:hypothetical protein